MVSRDQYNLRMRQFGKKKIHFLQLLHKRLSVKQIPRDQKKIRALPLTDRYHPPECIPQFPCTLPAVKGPRVRARPQMHIRNMNKPHPLPPFHLC